MFLGGSSDDNSFLCCERAVLLAVGDPLSCVQRGDYVVKVFCVEAVVQRLVYPCKSGQKQVGPRNLWLR